jgi:hypothetical protein
VLVLASFFLLDIFDVAAAEFYFEESGGTVEVICCFVFLYFAGIEHVDYDEGDASHVISFDVEFDVVLFFAVFLELFVEFLLFRL